MDIVIKIQYHGYIVTFKGLNNIQAYVPDWFLCTVCACARSPRGPYPHVHLGWRHARTHIARPTAPRVRRASREASRSRAMPSSRRDARPPAPRVPARPRARPDARSRASSGPHLPEASPARASPPRPSRDAAFSAASPSPRGDAVATAISPRALLPGRAGHGGGACIAPKYSPEFVRERTLSSPWCQGAARGVEICVSLTHELAGVRQVHRRGDVKGRSKDLRNKLARSGRASKAGRCSTDRMSWRGLHGAAHEAAGRRAGVPSSGRSRSWSELGRPLTRCSVSSRKHARRTASLGQVCSASCARPARRWR